MRPVALYVKGTRIMIPDGLARASFENGTQRDGAIANLPNISKGGGAGATATKTLDTSRAFVIERGRADIPSLRVGNNIGFVIQKGLQGGITITEPESGPSKVVDGENTWPTAELNQASQGLERSLRVDSFNVDPDVSLVHVIVNGDPEENPLSFLSTIPSNADRRSPVQLVDTTGQRYEPIGFIYVDDINTTLRYKPGEPISSMEALPRLSRSRPNLLLTLIFRTSAGVQLKYLAIGDTAYAEMNPPIVTGEGN
jgi:hypothetical protein